MDQRRRILLLIVLVVAIVGGNIAVQMWLAPPPQPKVDKVVKVLRDVEQAYPLTLLGEIPSPFKPPATLLLPDPKQYAEKKAETQKLLAERRQKEAAEVAEKKAAAKKAVKPGKDVVLGDDSTKLRVVLSEENATVRKVTLNGYQAASRRDALPEYVDEKEKTPRPFTILDDEGNVAKQSYDLMVGTKDAPWPIQWKLEKANAQEAIFIGEVPAKKLTVRKHFRLRPDAYHVDLELEFVNTGTEAWEVVYWMTGPRSGPPIEGEIWQARTIRNVIIGAKETDKHQRFQLFTGLRSQKNVEKPKLEDMEPHARQLVLSNPVTEDGTVFSPLAMQYAGVTVPFFAALIVPDGDALQLRYIDEVLIFYGEELKQTAKDQIGTVVLVSKPVQIEAGKALQHRYLLYSGPSKVRLLGHEAGVPEDLVQRYENELQLAQITDAADRSWWGGKLSHFLGWTWLIVRFTNLMHGILEWLHSVGAPYWLAIICLTVLVRGAMFPISRRQALMSRNMQEKMAKLKPELAKIQEKYKDDYQARSAAQMELYRKHGVSPFGGCMGCLVVLLQMPVFLGLYWALNESVHLRLAGFLWIENLAAPDMLLHWENWPVIGWLASVRNPVSGLQILGPYFNLLPLVSVAFMLVQQKLIAPPALDDQQAMQMKMMNYMMILFAWLFYWVASGLCLYFTISSAWALVERKLLPKKKAETPAVVAPPTGKRKPDRIPRDGHSNGLFGRLGRWWRDLLEKAEKK